MGVDTSQLLIICYIVFQSTITLAVAIIAGRALAEFHSLKQQSYRKLFTTWVKTTWKMRSIYTCVVIHVFDLTTDLLVIREWFLAEDEKGEDVQHVDATSMAWTSIGILIFYRIISALGIFVTVAFDWKVAVLQFFDVLLLVEVHRMHQRLVKVIVGRYIGIGHKNNDASITSDNNDQNPQQSGQSSVIVGV